MYTHSSFGCISKHLKLDIPSASMNLFCLDYFGYFRKYRRFVGVNIKHTRKSSEGYTDGVMDRQENISVLNLRNFTTCKNHVSEDESSHEKFMCQIYSTLLEIFIVLKQEENILSFIVKIIKAARELTNVIFQFVNISNS